MSLFSLLFKYKDKKSPDKLGLYPGDLHVPAFPERRYLYTSRTLVICAVFSICINIALISIIYILIPQKKSTPLFLSIDENSHKLTSLDTQSKSVPYLDLLSEKYIYDYIIMRHEIPISTADLYYKWDEDSKFYWYSTPRTYSSFINKLDKRQIRNFILQKMKRTIQINSIKKVHTNFWEAEFTTSTTTKNMTTPDIIFWKAYLRIGYLAFTEYENIEKDKTDKINYTQNPFGFKVLSYDVSYAGKPKKSYTAIQTAQKVFENLEDVVK